MSLTPGGPLNPVRAPKTSDFSILAWVLTSGSPLWSREFRVKGRKFSWSEKSIDFFSKTKPQIKNPLQRFEALYVGWLWSKYEAKRPSGCEDYRLWSLGSLFFLGEPYLRSIYIGILMILVITRSFVDDFRTDFGENPLVVRQVYNLRRQWSVWLHIWTRCSPGMLLENVVSDFRFLAWFSRTARPKFRKWSRANFCQDRANFT